MKGIYKGLHFEVKQYVDFKSIVTLSYWKLVRYMYGPDWTKGKDEDKDFTQRCFFSDFRIVFLGD